MSGTLAILVVVGLSLVGVLGDYFLKLAGHETTIAVKWFIIGAVVYSSTAVGWFFVLKHIKLATLGLVYSMTTTIALTIIGVLVFKEAMSPFEYLGLIFGFSSIILLARFV